ncbi:MAG: class II aldolase/adducin family protein [Pseudomonadota bacterium]
MARASESQCTLSESEEWDLRVDLAAAFRWAERFNWHESVANHFSASLSANGRRFLLNPKWKHFSTISASDLVVVDLDDPDSASNTELVDPSALTIHGSVHSALPNAKVLLHCHPDYATALSTLKDPSFRPIDQNTCRFYNRMAIDLSFGGFGDDQEEGARLARAMGNHSTMMMGNHGVAVTAETVAHAFEQLYYLERASKTLMVAYASGQPLNELSPDVAEKTAQSWDNYRGISDAHFTHLKSQLDNEDPSYRH